MHQQNKITPLRDLPLTFAELAVELGFFEPLAPEAGVVEVGLGDSPLLGVALTSQGKFLVELLGDLNNLLGLLCVHLDLLLDQLRLGSGDVLDDAGLLHHFLLDIPLFRFFDYHGGRVILFLNGVAEMVLADLLELDGRTLKTVMGFLILGLDDFYLECLSSNFPQSQLKIIIILDQYVVLLAILVLENKIFRQTVAKNFIYLSQ